MLGQLGSAWPGQRNMSRRVLGILIIAFRSCCISNCKCVCECSSVWQVPLDAGLSTQLLLCGGQRWRVLCGVYAVAAVAVAACRHFVLFVICNCLSCLHVLFCVLCKFPFFIFLPYIDTYIPAHKLDVLYSILLGG